MRKLSVIIVSYNTKEILKNCLESIYCILGNANEIIVVDNNSVDGTREMLRQRYHKVKLILNDKNLGFGAANNRGMLISKGKFILLLNSDTVASEKTIAECLGFASRNTDVGVLGCRLQKPNGNLQLSCGKAYTLWNSIFGSTDITKDRD